MHGAAVGGGRHRPRWAGWCARRSRTCSTPSPTSDVAKAHDVWERDEEIDEVYTGLFRELLTYMMEDPRTITACTHLLFMAKNIERIGDHATNIAEMVSFRITGHGFDEARPKGSASLYAAGDRVMSMAAQAPSRRDTQTPSIKPRVLIVEDEAPLVELLRYNLEQAGFRVVGRL